MNQLSKEISDIFYDLMDMRGTVSALTARKICEEIVGLAIQSHDRELMRKIKGLSGKLWQPVSGLSNIEWITKDQVLNLLDSNTEGK